MRSIRHAVKLHWQQIGLMAGLLLTFFGLLGACSTPSSPTPTPAPALADELVFYYWADYFPQSILDNFTAEYGVKVRYEIYESYEEAVQKIRTANQYDVAIIGTELIPGLIADGALAQINYQQVPNFINISANFRDLAYDPGNLYSVPYYWGTTGLVVRTDLVKKPVRRWADLWDPEFAGKIVVWPMQGSLLPIALKSLGYSATSEEPAQLEEALQQLLKLKKNASLLSTQIPSVVPILEAGEAAISYGWNYDALLAEQSPMPITYVLPEEGSILWGENYVLPANSARRSTAEIFLNFVLRPEMSAQIVNEFYYSVPNELAAEFIQPEIRNNPNVFPPASTLKNAEMILPLSAEGQKLWDEVWQRFMTAD